jgi:uncharacterized protein YegJ (DUF2314 family)
MSESQSSNVTMFDNNDPAMQAACENARSTFRYFWREVSWERRRIVPALDLACVKAPFTDGPRGQQGKPQVEQMWLGEVDFDGEVVSGVLLNSPNWLQSIQAGDSAQFPLREISDWMYAISGEVYGAWTVNLLRSRMSARERKEHDSAWGLNFGDPAKVRVIPAKWGPGGKSSQLDQEHPMSESMASSLTEHLAKNPSLLRDKGDRGWTLLHNQALAGSLATVKVLLDAGADPNAVGDDGRTPLQLARSLGWDRVAALLVSKGAK